MSDEVSPRAASYPTAVICKLLDLTPQRISQLTSAGVLQKAERNRYYLVPTVRAYVRYLRERQIGRHEGGDDIQKSRARLLELQADIAELDKAEREGVVIRAADVEMAWGQMVGNARARLLSIPKKLAARIAADMTMAEKEKAIEDEIHAALKELSETNVEYQSSERNGSEDDQEGDGAVEAAAEADGEPVG